MKYSDLESPELRGAVRKAKTRAARRKKGNGARGDKDVPSTNGGAEEAHVDLHDAEISRLAKLGLIQYEQERKAAA
jgi:hypothetical protein